MNNGKMSVGLNQRIRLEWLERTATLVREGNHRAVVHDALNYLLADELAVGSNTRRNSRAKTIIILLKIWLDGPPEIAALRNTGQALLETLPTVDRLAIHWGMTLAAYPFWGIVATCVGRLLRLQGAASASQVQRRLCEIYGDRETVSHAANRVLRSFVDWGALSAARGRGIFETSEGLDVVSPKLAAWLVEALLTGHADSASSMNLLNHPSLFPFRVAPMHGCELVAHSPRLELLQGIDDDLVMLRSGNR